MTEQTQTKTPASTIDITLTWMSLIPVLVDVANNAPDKEARDFAMAELMRLAQIVDHHIANLKTLKKEVEPKGNIICPDCGVRGGHAFGCPLSDHHGV